MRTQTHAPVPSKPCSDAVRTTRQAVAESQDLAKLRQMQHIYGNQVVQRAMRSMLQAKRTVNQPDDQYEQEADRIADQVVRMPERELKHQCACENETFGKCDACTRLKEHSLQRQATSLPANSDVPPIVDDVLREPGEPLDAITRAFFEPRFGASFGAVRVHRGQNAVRSAAAVHARAYTVGNHIAFGNNALNLSSSEGQTLLAHELTHTLQQSPFDSGQSGRSVLASGPSLQRDTDPELLDSELSSLDAYLARTDISESDRASAKRRLRQLELDSRKSSNSLPSGTNKSMVTAGSSARKAETPNPLVPRPEALPLANAFTLYQIVDAPSEFAASIPENEVVTISLPMSPRDSSGMNSHRITSVTTPAAGAGASVLTNTARSLIATGHIAVPGGNGIGLIGIPRWGQGGLGTFPPGLPAGHTSVVIIREGQVAAIRGFHPEIMKTAPTDWLKVFAGEKSVPGIIKNDPAMLLNAEARQVMWPVSAETADGFLESLPKPGETPELLYTGRPNVRGVPGTTNCVGWACTQVENAGGGRVGSTSEGAIDPLMEPVPPEQGLQGRYMKMATKGEIATLPEATGPAIRGGMRPAIRVLRVAGKVFIVLGAVAVGYEIATAPKGERGRTAAREGTGFAAGLATGAAAGLVCGPGALFCSVALGLVFGLGGYFAGRATGEAIYDQATGK